MDKTDLNGRQILLIKQSSLGDIVHALPVAHALKRCFPDSHLGWVVEQGMAALLERDPAIERLHRIHIPSTSEPGAPWTVYGQAAGAMIRTLRGLRREFTAHPYHLILDLHASFRSGLFGLANPGGRRIGFGDARELNTRFQDVVLPVPSSETHAVEKNLLFCRYLGCEPAAEDFHLATGRDDEAQAAAFVREKIGAGQRFVYFNPTARWQSKFWLDDRWNALGDRLEAEGIRVVYGGGPGDRAYLERLMDGMRHQAVLAAGQLSLMASVALMKQAAAYVGVDTGPMHIAAMVGIPVVALFGPTHPQRVGPYGQRTAVLQAPGLDCLCCRKRVCSHQRCMYGIEVETVYQRLMALLQEVAKR